jgi:CRISPR system Cascade subunit CasB
MTFYGAHQQSQDQSMHHRGVGLGQAIGALDRTVRAPDTDGPSAVRRRFDAAVTSASLPELIHHIRGLIGQLRAASIGLDYGMLAKDFLDFQHAERADDVRRRWARQFYFPSRTDTGADTTNEPLTSQDSIPEEPS